MSKTTGAEGSPPTDPPPAQPGPYDSPLGNTAATEAPHNAAPATTVATDEPPEPEAAETPSMYPEDNRPRSQIDLQYLACRLVADPVDHHQAYKDYESAVGWDEDRMLWRLEDACDYLEASRDVLASLDSPTLLALIEATLDLHAAMANEWVATFGSVSGLTEAVLLSRIRPADRPREDAVRSEIAMSLVLATQARALCQFPGGPYLGRLSIERLAGCARREQRATVEHLTELAHRVARTAIERPEALAFKCIQSPLKQYPRAGWPELEVSETGPRLSQFLRLGIKAEEAEAWDMGFDQAEEWIKVGATLAEAHTWIRARLGFSEAAEFRDLPNYCDDYESYTSLIQLARQLHRDISLRNWLDAGHTPTDIRTYLLAGYELSEATGMTAATEMLAALNPAHNA